MSLRASSHRERELKKEDLRVELVIARRQAGIRYRLEVLKKIATLEIFFQSETEAPYLHLLCQRAPMF